jgi:hypothetical protein
MYREAPGAALSTALLVILMEEAAIRIVALVTKW